VIASKFNKKSLVALSGVLILLAGFWPSVNSRLSPELSASILRAASNGWAWFELLVVAVLILALRGYGPLSSLMHLPVPIPDEDITQLKKKLEPWAHLDPPKIQIIYANRKNARDFAHELSDILIDVGWIQVQPPSAIFQLARIPSTVLTVRSSHVDPGLGNAIKISLALEAIGLMVSRQEDPKLRKHEHCILYVNGF
jgi:hypothetical protein